MPDMLDPINHNKYGKQQEIEEELKYKLMKENQLLYDQQKQYDYDEYEDGESSP